MTQVDPPNSMLVFKSVAADQTVSQLEPESADYLLCREQGERSAAKNAKCGIARSIIRSWRRPMPTCVEGTVDDQLSFVAAFTFSSSLSSSSPDGPPS